MKTLDFFKKTAFVLCLLFNFLFLDAQEQIVVFQGNAHIFNENIGNMQTITFSGGNSVFTLQNGVNQTILTSSIDSVIFVSEPLADRIRITWNGSVAAIENPYSTQGISVTASGANVTVTANSSLENIEYELLGSSADGYVNIISNKNIILNINNLQLTSTSKAVVKIASAVAAQIILQGNNTLSSTSNNTLTTSGEFIFGGNGTLNIASTPADVKAIKADGNLTFNNGTYIINVSGAQSKAIASNGDIVFNNGTFDVETSGDVVLEASGSGYATSYCTAIKADGSVTVNKGSITVTSTTSSRGGKGISAGGDVIINGGIVNISTAGNGATYINSNGATDAYTASCITSDANVILNGGNLALSSSGTGGKCINADGYITIGKLGADNNALVLNAATSGARFYVSGSTGGGGWGGGDNADYANPKAIKATGNITVNSGTITVRCTQTADGGEGLESKNTLTINGGIIDVETYDDCINAANQLVINDGNIRVKSSNNDGFDSNGTLTVNGGFIISGGAGGAEEGFDCDNNTFKITGGTMIGTGGNSSTPTSSVCTQRSILFSAAGNTAVCLVNSSDDIILLYQTPAITSSGGGGGSPGGQNGSMKILFSSPQLATGSYTLKTGGVISGGVTTNGYNTGGTYSGGTSRNITVSGMVTSVN
ncbi:MAG: carbohydrate-binding domain-containing protein [Dysgonamonadaceae bacterium]|jgi:hypothetical protein|nr:carbohydrate-binding domain-containing protein [Dysgonamonadaceae bacterium]